jgi:hypothetical protein
MFRLFCKVTLAMAVALVLIAPAAEAAGKKKVTARARGPASQGFKVKISGDFTRVIDEEQGIVCYFAKSGGGSCVNLPR